MVLNSYIFPFYYHLNTIKVKSKSGSSAWAYFRLLIEFLQVLHYVLSANSTLPWPLSNKVISSFEVYMRGIGVKEETIQNIIVKEQPWVDATDQRVLRIISEYLSYVFPLKFTDIDVTLKITVSLLCLYTFFLSAGIYTVKKHSSLQAFGSIRNIYCGVISWVSTVFYMPLLDALLSGTVRQDGAAPGFIAASAIFLPLLVTGAYFFLISEAKCSLSSVYPSARTNSIVDAWMFIARTLIPFLHIYLEEFAPVVIFAVYAVLTVIPLLCTMYFIPYGEFSFSKARVAALTTLFIFQVAQIEAIRQWEELKAIAALGLVDLKTTLGVFYLNDRVYDGRVSTTIVVFLTPLTVFLLVQAMESWRSHCTSMGLESVNSAHILALKVRRYLVTKRGEMKPEVDIASYIKRDEDESKKKKKKGIKFLKKDKKQNSDDSSSDDDNGKRKKENPVDEIKLWLIDLTDKLEKDAYFHVISYLFYYNIAKDKFFSSIQYHKLYKYMQGLNWFGKLKNLDLYYLCFDYGQNLKAKSDKTERELFRYLRLQRIRKQVYFRQRTLFTLQLEMYNELKDLQLAGSDSSSTLMYRSGNDILKVYNKVTTICQLIQDTSKLLADMIRINTLSAFSYKCYAQFLLSFTSQYVKAVDMLAKSRDIEMNVVGEALEEARQEQVSSRAGSRTGSRTKSRSSDGGSSVTGSSRYQLNFDDMLSDAFDLISFVVIMSGEKNEEGTMLDVYGAMEQLLLFPKY
jgi:hypothetical protein